MKRQNSPIPLIVIAGTLFLAAIAIVGTSDKSDLRVETNSDSLSNRTDLELASFDRRKGFADIKFGEKIQELEFLEPLDRSRPFLVPRRSYQTVDLDWYKRKTEFKTISGVPFQEIYYGFHDGQFVEAAIVFEPGSEAGRNILDIVRKNFKGNLAGGAWIWIGTNVGIDVTGFCNLESSILCFMYVFPAERIASSYKITQKSPQQRDFEKVSGD